MDPFVNINLFDDSRAQVYIELMAKNLEKYSTDTRLSKKMAIDL